MRDYSVEFLMSAFKADEIVRIETRKTNLHTAERYDEVCIDKVNHKIVKENGILELTEEAIRNVLEEENRYEAALFNAEGKKIGFEDIWELAVQNGCSAASLLKVAVW